MVTGDEFLDSISRQVRPEPNITGNFDCQTCYEPTNEAHYDAAAKLLRWWCANDHESRIEKVEL